MYEEYYDLMAQIICDVLHLEGFQPEALDVIETNEEQGLDEEAQQIIGSEDDQELLRLVKQKVGEQCEDGYFLLILLQKLDQIANRKLKKYIERNAIYDHFEIESLNSQKSVEETGIMLIPRFQCEWNGISRERNHLTNINSFLEYSFFVNKTGGLFQNGYKLKNIILNPKYYDCTRDELGKMHLVVGLSPVSKNVELKVKYFKRVEDGHNVQCFQIESFDEKTEEEIISSVISTIEEAEKNGIQILIFPEMLGSIKLLERAKERIQNLLLQNIQIVVLPSMWEKGQNGEKGTNISYVINYCADELFGQEKLRCYVHEADGKKYREDISEGKSVFLVHVKGIGSLAILICRSELDIDIRTMLQYELNTKMILCPSWTQGHNEFERSIMTSSELNCNVAWCNCCSAISKEKFQNRIVGIITAYGKNKEESTNELKDRCFPKDKCDEKCIDGCLFWERIYGRTDVEVEEF